MRCVVQMSRGDRIVASSKVQWEVSPNNYVDWVSRKQIYKPNSKSLSRFG